MKRFHYYNLRLFWIGSLSMSMLICGVLVVELYDQLINHPIIIAMDDKSYDIKNVSYFKCQNNFYIKSILDSVSSHHNHYRV